MSEQESNSEKSREIVQFADSDHYLQSGCPEGRKELLPSSSESEHEKNEKQEKIQILPIQQQMKSSKSCQADALPGCHIDDQQSQNPNPLSNLTQQSNKIPSQQENAEHQENSQHQYTSEHQGNSQHQLNSSSPPTPSLESFQLIPSSHLVSPTSLDQPPQVQSLHPSIGLLGPKNLLKPQLSPNPSPPSNQQQSSVHTPVPIANLSDPVLPQKVSISITPPTNLERLESREFNPSKSIEVTPKEILTNPIHSDPISIIGESTPPSTIQNPPQPFQTSQDQKSSAPALPSPSPDYFPKSTLPVNNENSEQIQDLNQKIQLPLPTTQQTHPAPFSMPTSSIYPLPTTSSIGQIPSFHSQNQEGSSAAIKSPSQVLQVGQTQLIPSLTQTAFLQDSLINSIIIEESTLLSTQSYIEKPTGKLLFNGPNLQVSREIGHQIEQTLHTEKPDSIPADLIENSTKFGRSAEGIQIVNPSEIKIVEGMKRAGEMGQNQGWKGSHSSVDAEGREDAEQSSPGLEGKTGRIATRLASESKMSQKVEDASGRDNQTDLPIYNQIPPIASPEAGLEVLISPEENSLAIESVQTSIPHSSSISDQSNLNLLPISHNPRALPSSHVSDQFPSGTRTEAPNQINSLSESILEGQPSSEQIILSRIPVEPGFQSGLAIENSLSKSGQSPTEEQLMNPHEILRCLSLTISEKLQDSVLNRQDQEFEAAINDPEKNRISDDQLSNSNSDRSNRQMSPTYFNIPAEPPPLIGQGGTYSGTNFNVFDTIYEVPEELSQSIDFGRSFQNPFHLLSRGNPTEMSLSKDQEEELLPKAFPRNIHPPFLNLEKDQEKAEEPKLGELNEWDQKLRVETGFAEFSPQKTLESQEFIADEQPESGEQVASTPSTSLKEFFSQGIPSLHRGKGSRKEEEGEENEKEGYVNPPPSPRSVSQSSCYFAPAPIPQVDEGSAADSQLGDSPSPSEIKSPVYIKSSIPADFQGLLPSDSNFLTPSIITRSASEPRQSLIKNFSLENKSPPQQSFNRCQSVKNQIPVASIHNSPENLDEFLHKKIQTDTEFLGNQLTDTISEKTNTKPTTPCELSRDKYDPSALNDHKINPDSQAKTNQSKDLESVATDSIIHSIAKQSQNIPPLVEQIEFTKSYQHPSTFTLSEQPTATHNPESLSILKINSPCSLDAPASQPNTEKEVLEKLTLLSKTSPHVPFQASNPGKEYKDQHAPNPPSQLPSQIFMHRRIVSEMISNPRVSPAGLPPINAIRHQAEMQALGIAGIWRRQDCAVSSIYQPPIQLAEREAKDHFMIHSYPKKVYWAGNLDQNNRGVSTETGNINTDNSRCLLQSYLNSAQSRLTHIQTVAQDHSRGISDAGQISLLGHLRSKTFTQCNLSPETREAKFASYSKGAGWIERMSMEEALRRKSQRQRIQEKEKNVKGIKHNGNEILDELQEERMRKKERRSPYGSKVKIQITSQRKSKQSQDPNRPFFFCGRKDILNEKIFQIKEPYQSQSENLLKKPLTPYRLLTHEEEGKRISPDPRSTPSQTLIEKEFKRILPYNSQPSQENQLFHRSQDRPELKISDLESANQYYPLQIYTKGIGMTVEQKYLVGQKGSSPKSKSPSPSRKRRLVVTLVHHK